MTTAQKDIKYLRKALDADASELLETAANGLEYKFMPALMDLFGLEFEDMSRQIEVSPRTLHGRKKSRVFNKHESERLLRLARLYLLALDAFDSPGFTREWFKTPKPALGGATPLDYMKSEIGAREVEDLLGRIRHGVFS